MIDKMGEIVSGPSMKRTSSLSDLDAFLYPVTSTAEYLMQAGIHCTVEAPGEFPCRFVSGEFRRNIYLTIKEALHNVVKTMQQRKGVNIRMEVGRELAITIQDDGIGL